MWDVVVLVAMLYTALWVPIEVTILDWSEDYKEALDARWVVNRVFDVAFLAFRFGKVYRSEDRFHEPSSLFSSISSLIYALILRAYEFEIFTFKKI